MSERISMNFYECISRLNSIEEQYEIALFAFDLYQKEKEAELSDLMEKRKAEFFKYIELIKKEKAEKNEKFDESKFKKYYGPLFGIYEEMLLYPGKQADQLKNSIRQNSLILTLSTFEIFLNDLLRHILLNRPNLLSPNRKIEIGRLITDGVDKVISEEVERQVYTIDRKSIFDRADYFKTHLKLYWGKDSNHIEIFNKINNLRNNIVHRDTDLMVSEEDLKEALRVCKAIVIQLMIDSMKHYKDIIAPLIMQKQTSKT